LKRDLTRAIFNLPRTSRRSRQNPLHDGLGLSLYASDSIAKVHLPSARRARFDIGGADAYMWKELTGEIRN